MYNDHFISFFLLCFNFSLSLSLFSQVTVGDQNQLYLPFIDFECVARESGLVPENTTSVSLDTYRTLYEYVSTSLSPFPHLLLSLFI